MMRSALNDNDGKTDAAASISACQPAEVGGGQHFRHFQKELPSHFRRVMCAGDNNTTS